MTVLFFGDTTADKPYRDSSGRPLVGAELMVWKHGTTIPAKVVGEDGFPLEPPFVTDASGVLPSLYLDPDKSYRVRMVDARGVLVFDVDPYRSSDALFRSPIYHAVTPEGRPIAGAQLEFRDLLTGEPKDIYADGEKLARHPNPIRADAGGFFPEIYLQRPQTPADVYEATPSFADDPIYDPPVNARFVAVASAGDGERIAWSDDGDVWHAADTEPDGEWRDVVYAPEIDTFVAVGLDNQIARSTDGGKTWTLCNVPSAELVEDFISAIWIPGAGANQGRFVVGQRFSASGVGRNAFVYSDDGGVTWTRTGEDLGVTFRANQFACHGSLLLAAGSYTTSSEEIAISRTGGATWVSLANIPSMNVATGIVRSAILDLFVSGNGGLVSGSPDGETWTTIASAAIGRLWEFPRWGRLFTITADSNVRASPDAANWEIVLPGPLNVSLLGLAGSDLAGLLVAVGGESGGGLTPLVYRSETLTGWTPATTPPARSRWESVTAGLALTPRTPLPVPATPEITSLDPPNVEEGSGAFTLTVHGANFLPPDHQAASVVRWNGADRATTYVSDTELQAAIPATDVEMEGTASVTVANGDMVSDPETFTVFPGAEPFWGIETFSGGQAVGLSERLGWQFQVGDEPLLCNRLRVRSGSPERVRIHRVSDGALIATADITGIDSGTWVSQAVSQFTLEAGEEYTCSSRHQSGTSRALVRNETVQVFAGVTKTANVFGGNDDMPTSTTSNAYAFCDFGYEE